MSKHIAVWLDHKEARVFKFAGESAVETTIHGPPHNDHHHWTHEQKGLKEHPEDVLRFFREVAASLGKAEALLIVGPGSAKLQFFRFLHEHHRALEPKVVGIETVDHPSDGQLIAYARKHFETRDKMG
jgi:stalled ribosome rescue protein Dom34